MVKASPTLTPCCMCAFLPVIKVLTWAVLRKRSGMPCSDRRVGALASGHRGQRGCHLACNTLLAGAPPGPPSSSNSDSAVICNCTFLIPQDLRCRLAVMPMIVLSQSRASPMQAVIRFLGGATFMLPGRCAYADLCYGSTKPEMLSLGCYRVFNNFHAAFSFFALESRLLAVA